MKKTKSYKESVVSPRQKKVNSTVSTRTQINGKKETQMVMDHGNMSALQCWLIIELARRIKVVLERFGEEIIVMKKLAYQH